MKLNLSKKLLTEFATSVAKVISKPKQLCITGAGGYVHFFIIQDARQVAFSTEIELQDSNVIIDFDVAVDAVKFLATVKHLSDNSLFLDFKPKGVTLKYSDVNVKLPFQTANISWAQLEYTEVDVPLGFLKGLTCTDFVPETDVRFTGMLIDQLDNSSIIAKFSGSALSLVQVPYRFLSRFVIFKDFSKLVNSKTKFVSLLTSDRGFGVKTESGVSITGTLLDDRYLTNYMWSLKLATNGPLVVRSKFDLCYQFDVQDLKAAVAVVASVIGDEEQSVQFTVLSAEVATSEFTWEILAKSYTGAQVSECVRSIGDLKAVPQAFRLHKKTLLKALNNYSDTLYLIDEDNMVILSDSIGDVVAILIKLG